MMPQEWQNMGGQDCSDCSTCIRSEWALVKAFPDTADQLFQSHWESWFTQSDVDALQQLGLNTVRIPLGFWIVEPLVDSSSEFYAKGGIKELKRGLGQLKAAGISAILDHHAVPGVQWADNPNTGQCTSNVQFYTDANYHRALIWAAVMTALSHLDPDFGSVFAIEAVNEVIMDASQTPGYGDYQSNFVETVRAVELSLGVQVPGLQAAGSTTGNATTDLLQMAQELSGSNAEISQVLSDAAPMLAWAMSDLGLTSSTPSSTSALYTLFMDYNWQTGDKSNPAAAAIGPQFYDNHLYYAFGGTADATTDAYLTSLCTLNRVQADAESSNSPLVFGEWSLQTEFTADDSFLVQFADAQKMAYSQGAGWIYWNFKVENSSLSGDLGRQWSYYEGISRGYFTQDPSAYHDSTVCNSYGGSSTASSSQASSASSPASTSSNTPSTSTSDSLSSSGTLSASTASVEAASSSSSTPVASSSASTLDPAATSRLTSPSASS
ncbi:glycoside hydrolase [Schizopora paradoxa]|uniref:Glycoside hydrolase n=1 Tax=Schizopora paradoxa TaxID=27342 RepID=A0A0H2RP94_9AGAM|nr:glycoside hydrolase [Schizopora paradoxa]